MKIDPIMDVGSLINQSRFGSYQALICVLCFFAVAIDGFDTGALGYVAPSLAAEWGIPRPALGPVLSAALFGLAVGAIAAGPLADRFGRKSVVIVSVALFGAFSLGTSLAPGLETMTVLRFLTGIGLGAAMPNAVTLMSEYSPLGRRAVIVNTMFCGFPLGASMGGMLAAWLIPHFGWRSVLVVGGLAPLVLAVFLIVLLPESVRFLVLHGRDLAKVRAILTRIASRNLDAIERFVVDEPKHDRKGAIGIIVSAQYRLGSIMLWLTYFMGLVIFYLLTNWMPLIMKDAGFSTETSVMLSALFPLGGGVGTIFVGWLMDRVTPHKVIATAYGLTGLLVFAVGQSLSEPALLAIVIFLAGTAMNGAQASMPSLAAGYYPTQARATGVSWMLGIGRFGGITGALVGGEIMKMQLGLSTTFTLLVIPAAVASAALVVKHLNRHGRTAAHHRPTRQAAEATGSAVTAPPLPVRE
jgi:AAHS family 4-hydroxybenzoate transporter-like MFS transporter